MRLLIHVTAVVRNDVAVIDDSSKAVLATVEARTQVSVRVVVGQRIRFVIRGIALEDSVCIRMMPWHYSLFVTPMGVALRASNCCTWCDAVFKAAASRIVMWQLDDRIVVQEMQRTPWMVADARHELSRWGPFDALMGAAALVKAAISYTEITKCGVYGGVFVDCRC